MYLSNFQYFRRINYLTCWSFIFICFIFSVFRFSFLWTYGGDNIWQGATLWPTFYWGLRMDMRTMAIVLALPWLLSLLFIIVPHHFCGTISKVQRYLIHYLLTLVTIFEVINHYYFKNFQNHIDIFIFQIMDWVNAVPVFKSIFMDYPLLPAVVVMLLVHKVYGMMLQYLWNKSARQHDIEKSTIFKWVYSVVSVLLLALFIRGSLGTFPLTLNRVALAGDVFYTQAVANGPLAFSEAWGDWQRLQHLQAVSNDEAVQAYKDYFGHAPKHQPLRLNDLLVPAQVSSPQQHPNIVMVQMESFGGHILDAHDRKNNNLLGRLEPHLQQDFFFNRFAPLGMGTLITLERILLNSGVGNISKTPYRDAPYHFAVARMLQNAGYETIFLTGGHKTWGQIQALLSHQGFDHVLGGDDILAAIPQAQDDGTWGVFDAYLFQYMQYLLQQKRNKPLFIYAMPVSNHLPYMLPESYHPKAVKLPEAWIPLLVDHDKEKGHLILQSYQYSNDALGQFMDAVKANKNLASHTVVAASGDHNMRDLITYRGEPGRQHRVPLYLYLPPQYAKNTVRDTQRIGSHNDIFPTIFRHALPDIPSYGLGQDLLAPNFNHAQALAISTGYFMNDEGCALVGDHQVSYYHWKNQVGQSVKPIQGEPSPHFQHDTLKYRAYYTLQRWQMYEIASHQNSHP